MEMSRIIETLKQLRRKHKEEKTLNRKKSVTIKEKLEEKFKECDIERLPSFVGFFLVLLDIIL